MSVTDVVAAGRGEAGAAVTGAGVAGATGAGVGVAVASTGFASFRSDNAGGTQSSGITPKEKAAIPAAAPSARMRSIPMNFAIRVSRAGYSSRLRFKQASKHSASASPLPTPT